MVFCEVISQIQEPWTPLKMELTLFDLVADQKISHVEGLRSSLFNLVINKIVGSGVVSADWGCWSGMTHFY